MAFGKAMSYVSLELDNRGGWPCVIVLLLVGDMDYC